MAPRADTLGQRWMSTLGQRNGQPLFNIGPTLACYLGLSVQEKFNIDFEDSGYGVNLGFPIRTSLAIFYLQVTPILSTRSYFSLPFGSAEEAQIDFSSWPSWWPYWIFDRNDFTHFLILKSPWYFESVGILVQVTKGKTDFQDGRLGAILESDQNDFSFYDIQVVPILCY